MHLREEADDSLGKSLTFRRPLLWLRQEGMRAWGRTVAAGMVGERGGGEVERGRNRSDRQVLSVICVQRNGKVENDV